MPYDPSYDQSNIFAKILRGEIRCHKVYEDAKALAFLDIMPRAPGHTLVIPKAAARNILDVDPGDFAHVMTVSQRIAKISVNRVRRRRRDAATVQRARRRTSGVSSPRPRDSAQGRHRAQATGERQGSPRGAQGSGGKARRGAWPSFVMNRKDRRAAGKRGGGPFAPSSGPGALAGNLFAAAVQHFQARRLDEAERTCRDVLTFDRNHAHALHLLGLIAHQSGRLDAALDFIGRALRARSPQCGLRVQHGAGAARARAHRGGDHAPDAGHRAAPRLRGRSSRARRHSLCSRAASPRQRRAISARSPLQNAAAETYSNFGVALAGLGHWDEAVAQYRRALALAGTRRRLAPVAISAASPAGAGQRHRSSPHPARFDDAGHAFAPQSWRAIIVWLIARSTSRSSPARCARARFSTRASHASSMARAIPKTGACGSVVDLFANPRLNHHAIVTGGVRADECGMLLSDFFAHRRQERNRSACPTAPCNSASTRPRASRPSRRRSIAPLRGSCALGSYGRRRSRRQEAASNASRRPTKSDWRRSLRMAAADLDVVVAVRGGYGWTRLLDRIDYAALAARQQRWLGHSDFTAFQLAALARAGMITFAGPMAAYDFGAEQPSAFTFEQCFGVLDHAAWEIGARSRAHRRWWRAGRCGAAICRWSLISRRHAVPAATSRAACSFVEDVGEHPYRVERLLYQLLHAGVLERQRAVMLGRVSPSISSNANDEGYDLAAAIAHLRERARCRSTPACRSATCATNSRSPSAGVACSKRATAWRDARCRTTAVKA